MNLKVKIANKIYPSPITVASGTFGHSEKFFKLEEVKKLGAITPKTVTLYAQEGNPPVRIYETPSGMINAIGIENPGADAFITQKIPPLQKTNVPLIISILGHSDDQFIQLIEKFNKVKGLHLIELNLSCPNLNHKTLVGQDPRAVKRLISKIKKVSKHPISAKLSPNVTDITAIAQAAEDAGADAISMINTFYAMAIDIEKRRSRIGNFTGGLSGPAIRPIAVKMVHDVAQKVKIPIIGMGGIMTPEDALEFLIAGATMVAVGTANFVNPRAPLDILNGIKDYMKRHKMKDIKEVIGSLRQP